jgi:hypothetical protein
MGVSEPTVERAKRRMRTDPEAHAKAKAGTLGRAKPSKQKNRQGYVVRATRAEDSDREPAKPRRSLLDAMGAVGSFTSAAARRYLAEHPDQEKRIVAAASVVAGVIAAVGKPAWNAKHPRCGNRAWSPPWPSLRGGCPSR